MQIVTYELREFTLNKEFQISTGLCFQPLNVVLGPNKKIVIVAKEETGASTRKLLVLENKSPVPNPLFQYVGTVHYSGDFAHVYYK